MEYAEKMYLVPSHQLEQLRNPPPPKEGNIRAATMHSLDTEMKGVLQRRDLTDYEKAKNFEILLQKFLAHVKQGETEKSRLSLFLPQSEAISEESPTSSDAIYQEIIDSMPARYKSHAMMLLNKMKQNKSVSSWDDRGVFVYKGENIKGSHLMDLVKAVTQTNDLPSHRMPKGLDVFMKAMAELNIPSSVVGNLTNRQALEHLKNPTSIAETPRLSQRASKKHQATPLSWISL